MDRAVLLKVILLSVFFFGGAFMILLGSLIGRRLRDSGSVEVEAECIDLGVHTAVIGTGTDKTRFPGARCPRYRYTYRGKQYVSGPKLASNRPGYQPALGRCTIRINPGHPEKVYSPERRFAALLLIGIGAAWIAMAALCAVLLPA